jgi:CBS domain-containing protein
MKLSDLMVKDVITLETDATVYDAVKLLNKNRIGCLIVMNKANVAGILTERDLLERVLEQCKDPKKTRVSQIMTKHVIAGEPDMNLLDATRLMFKARVKKLPVKDEHRLVGIVTLTDIARATCEDEKTIQLVEKLSNLHAIYNINV